jgi:hypothetical protein
VKTGEAASRQAAAKMDRGAHARVAWSDYLDERSLLQAKTEKLRALRLTASAPLDTSIRRLRG